MVKRGDVVILSLGGKEYNALVNAVNLFADSHAGANGEPTLHVSYVADDPIDNNTRKPKVMPIGYIPETTIVYDVVHESHEFSDDYKASHGLPITAPEHMTAAARAEIVNRRGAGEWREVNVIAQPTAADLDAAVKARVIKGSGA